MMRLRLNDNLINMIKCPVSGTELKIQGTNLISDSGLSYDITENIPILLPKSDSDFDYISHYTKDAEEFDYFEEFDCKATEDDVNRLRQMVLAEIPNTAQRVLDVGSGGAWLAKEMIKQKKHNTSFDLSFINIKRALKLNQSELHTGVVGDALNPPFKEKSFDCIIASEVIEHTDDPEKFVHSLLPLLKENGKLIVSTPYKEKIVYDLCIHCNEKTPRNSHLHSFDEKRLLNCRLPNYNAKHIIFGNKAMHMGRAYVITQYFSLRVWKYVDEVVNQIIKKPDHIIVIYSRA